jgi:signal transduction histidine kinase
MWRTLAGLDPRLVDGTLAVVLAAGATVQLLIEGPQRPLAIVSALGTGLPLAWRRRLPVRMYVAQIAFAILGARQPVTISLLATFIGLYSVAVYARQRWAAPLIVAVGALALFVRVPESSPTVPSWALELVGGLAIWLAGNTVRENQARADVLAERARRLERERELVTQLALADERRRIARELHDVVAHSVGVMVVQAGAARTVLGTRPERAGEALLQVEATGREALAELRRLLGVLTEVDAPAGSPGLPGHALGSLAPQPGLDELDRLAERLGSAGLPVEVHIRGQRRPLPPGLELCAYRVIQEALTNALKYARGARAEVTVAFGEQELGLEVLDGGGAPLAGAGGSGRGLLGMRERVAAYGGELEAGRRPEGGFAVRARLPLPA